MSKQQAIKKVMGDFPGMTEATAKYYVEEVLGYYAD